VDAQGQAAAFRKGLGEAGYVDGRNVLIEYRWAHGESHRLPELATDLVSRRVTVIATLGNIAATLAGKAATTAIPIVFMSGADPVQTGVVASLNRPGGNVTGYTLWTSEMESKRLGLLRELVPGVALIGILLNPRFPPTTEELNDLVSAAKDVNQNLFVAPADNDMELDSALNSLLQHRVGAFLVTASPFFDTRHGRIIEFAAQNKSPAIYQFREYAVHGGLISYGPNIVDSYHNGGIYVGRILKGEKPADLPVLQPTKFDFVINLKTAKALGLTVPPTLLAQAGEVIE
jgi:putative ABC transport system substrate-binding protein